MLAEVLCGNCVRQGYGFVEFARPSEAQKCKEAMEKIEQEMRPDVRRRHGNDHNPSNAHGEESHEKVSL